MRSAVRRWSFTIGVLATVAVVAGCRYESPNGGGPAPTATTGISSGAQETTAAAAPKQWTMPDLVGTGLQEAQDRIQALTHDAIFFTGSTDATGKGRQQILDRDWKVCSQNIPAGAVIDKDSKISFSVVKSSESCPSS